MNPGAFPPGTTPADFRHRPHSVLVNEVIANALFKGGKTEGKEILVFNASALLSWSAKVSPPLIAILLIKEDLIEHRYSDRNGGYYTK